jgi:hypothetical protein
MSDEARRFDWLIGVFILGVVLLSPPFLLLFGRGGMLFGLPLLLLYLFGAWAALIGAIAWIAERRHTGRAPSDED